MSQWGQQPGYQYPMQTGYPGGNFQQQQPQFQGQFQQQPQFQQNPGLAPGLVPQPTGYVPPRPLQQPQQTGMPGGHQGFLQSQPTGYGGFPQRPAPPPPPVPPMPSQFQGQGSNFLAPQQPNRSFLNSSPGPGLVPQATGFPGQRPLVAQPTGFVDPRLQMMSNSFMPMNMGSPYGAGGAPQLQPQQPVSLQQSFQQMQTQKPRVSWALGKAEKKQYEQIFRAWDARNTGFIDGKTALEVFGQSGLSKDDLARIWGLADGDDRGKLNMAEFHVAMGIIYRRLNGSEIPDVLPPELVPPSVNAMADSVNMVHDLLKNETRSRTPNSDVSLATQRSFVNNKYVEPGRDATIYRHDDEQSAYKPRTRHIDRDAVRSTSELNSSSADLSDMKRTLANTASMLDRAAEVDRQRTQEDEELEREMDDLKYRVKRINEDLDYVSRGPRSTAKDEERRKLERELMELTHVRVPEVERKLQAREDRRDREKRDQARDRDRRNERFGRFADRDDERDRYERDRDRDWDRDRRRYDDDRDRDRPYSRGGFRDDRDFDRGGSYRRASPARDRDYDRERDRERDRDRDYDRPRSAAPPEAAPAPAARPAPTPSPAPSSPAPATKNMTPEERQAFARAEARRRVEERMKALGVTPTPSPAIGTDSSVEERLAQEKKEAEEKAKIAAQEAEAREAARQSRLANEKAGTPAPTPTTTAAPSAPTPTAKVVPPAPKPKTAPPPPVSRSKVAPPPPKPRAAAAAPPPPKPQPVVDPEEELFKQQEAEMMRQREARAERMRKMQEEEARERAEEEAMEARMKAARAQAQAARTPSIGASVASLSTRSPSPVMVAAPTPPPAPPVTTPPERASGTNPFSKLIGQGAAATPPVATPPTNPWAQSTPQSSTPVATPPVAPAPPRTSHNPFPVAPPSAKGPYHTAPKDNIDDDWEDINEREQSDSDSDDDMNLRKKQQDMAKLIFGSGGGGGGGGSRSGTPATPASASGAPPPPPPPPPPGPPAPTSAGGGPAPPPPPPPPPVTALGGGGGSSAGPPDTSALMRAIQGGMSLRKTTTVDKSGPASSGRVIGDVAPPAHINAAPRAPSPPPPPAAAPPANNNRQSVDWYAGLAADSGPVAIDKMPMMREEVEEPYEPVVSPPPAIRVEEHVPEPEPEAGSDLMADIDKSVELKVRTLYAYEADGAEDITFGENVILIANPSKSGGEWWYGRSVSDGRTGMFPKTYVAEINPMPAKAIYAYTAANPDELSFAEGEMLDIIDTSEEEWWKVERGGVVYIVPAAYLEANPAPAPAPVMPDVRPILPTDATPTPPPPVVDEEPPIPTPRPASPVASGEQGQLHVVNLDIEADESDSSDSDSEDGYFSMSDEESDAEAREHERQRVLEAAGLIVKKAEDGEVKPPPRPVRRRSKDTEAGAGEGAPRRRPPPATPKADRSSVVSTSSTSGKELPPLPEAQTLDDAYDRYESFRGHHARLSVASIETNPPPASPSTSLAMSPSTSSASEGGRSYSHLLNFLGRKTPNADRDSAGTGAGTSMADRKAMISGPILQAPGDGASVSRSSSPAFGSSWASLVDKSALEGIPTQERKRQEAIFELIVTEETYVKDLQLIVETFYSSMMPLLERKAITVVFANIEDILLTNTTFMSSLEQRQKECRLYVDRIGDILQSHMSSMAVYMEYCVNQGNAIKVLKSLRDSNPELAAHLQRLKEDPLVRNLDLSSYLLAPMQRITRYPLLIKQILNYTEPGEEHKAVKRSITTAERILDHINESIRGQEGAETLKRISQNLWIGQGRLDLTAPTRHMGMRRLVKEGPLVKGKSGRKLHGFLCSDILVLTDASMKTLYRMPIPLNEAQVKEAPGGRDDTIFQVSLAYPRGGDAIVLRASSIRDCQLWMDAIEAAGRRCKEAEQKAIRVVAS